jgi:ABC-2 type transport system ATP-binding protein
MNVIETDGLSKAYGRSWALIDCTLRIPEGCLTALVGPNGAGKSTLMNMVAGLAVPTAGDVTVLGDCPAGAPRALNSVAFVAQDAPVYKNLSVRDMIHLTRNLNNRFDSAYATGRLNELGIPLGRKSGKLSGGQQSQLALTLALARKPRLLILDEPLAALDPLARQDFMATVMTAMTDDGVSVLLSSHAVADLERYTDYLVVLSGGRLQAVGETDDLIAEHRLLTGPADEADRIAELFTVVEMRRAAAQAHLMVRTSGPDEAVPPGWETHAITVEELVLSYLRAQRNPFSPRRSPVTR